MRTPEAQAEHEKVNAERREAMKAGCRDMLRDEIGRLATLTDRQLDRAIALAFHELDIDPEAVTPAEARLAMTQWRREVDAKMVETFGAP